MKQVRDRFLTFKSTQQCDQIGHFLLLRGVCFWRKSGPKLSKILGKFWNGSTFCQLGRNVFNMEDFLPQVPGHTASQWCLVTLLPNEAAFTSRTRCYFKNDQWEKQIDFQKIFSNAPAPASFCLLLSFLATQVVASDTRGPYFWFSHEHNLIPNEDIYLVSCWKERNKDKEAG